jgi:hypothetical protein
MKTDNTGMVIIWEVKSNDTLPLKLAENPASSFVEYAATPLMRGRNRYEDWHGDF